MWSHGRRCGQSEVSWTDMCSLRVVWMVCEHFWCHTVWCIDNTGVTQTGVWTLFGSPCLGYGHSWGPTNCDLVPSGFAQAPLWTVSVTDSGVWTCLGSQTRPRPLVKMHGEVDAGQMAVARILLDHHGPPWTPTSSTSLWCGLCWDHTNQGRDASRDTEMLGVGGPVFTLLWSH